MVPQHRMRQYGLADHAVDADAEELCPCGLLLKTAPQWCGALVHWLFNLARHKDNEVTV